MDSQEHILCLQRSYQFCGNPIKIDSHYRNAKLKGQFSDFFPKYFEADVNEENCNTFPPSLCQKCYIKLYKLDKSQTIQIIIITYSCIIFSLTVNTVLYVNLGQNLVYQR